MPLLSRIQDFSLSLHRRTTLQTVEQLRQMTQTAALIFTPESSEIENTGNNAGAASVCMIPREVVVAFREGDHRAFETIYLSCADSIRGFFRMILRNDAVAEELCQDLFVRIWENRHLVNPELNFRSYIRRAAKSSAMNYLRHRQVAEKYTSFRLNMDNRPDNAPDEQLMASELQLLIALALDKMPEQRRRVFRMSRVEGLPYTTIAESLGMSESTVRVHLFKALKDLSGLLSGMVTILLCI